MEIGVVRNPVAGGLLSRLRWRSIIRALRQVFPDLHLHETKSVGDGMRLGQVLADLGYDLVIAVGGDGTISEVVAGVLSSTEPQTPISFVPLGSGSDFARNFSLPKGASAIAAHIAKAIPRPVDAGFLLPTRSGDWGRAFVNIASIGISGNIVHAANRQGFSRLAGGALHFLFHSVREILRYKPARVRVVIDGEPVYRGPVVAVVCANGAWFGGGMHVMPMADIGDGLLDVGILRYTNRLGVLKLMLKFYTGAHLTDPNVSFHRGRIVEIAAKESASAIVEADGEEVGDGILRAAILPDALWLRM